MKFQEILRNHYICSQRLKFKKGIETLTDFVLLPSNIIQMEIVFLLQFHDFFDNLDVILQVNCTNFSKFLQNSKITLLTKIYFVVKIVQQTISDLLPAKSFQGNLVNHPIQLSGGSFCHFASLSRTSLFQTVQNSRFFSFQDHVYIRICFR